MLSEIWHRHDVTFPDHFSQQANDYARYRPLYPAALYDYLASLTPEHDRAWDVGTGNGQAAIGLARHYRSIIATDPSEQQIALATPHERVTYRVATAEHSEIEDRSIDLVTVALAVHWFDLDRFYAEVKRVLNPTVFSPYGATVSPKSHPKSMPCWCHTITTCWASSGRRRLHRVIEHYQALPFPFQEIVAPEFVMETAWSLQDLFGLLEQTGRRRKSTKQHTVLIPSTKSAPNFKPRGAQ